MKYNLFMKTMIIVFFTLTVSVENIISQIVSGFIVTILLIAYFTTSDARAEIIEKEEK